MTDKTTKICCICGDKAIGKNFGAITCESCKAFFRRTALKNKQLKCPFDDQCQINTITRKFCQKCRIKKCLAMGMKIDSLTNDRQKETIKRSIEYKRKISESVIDSTVDLPDSTHSNGSNSFELLFVNDFNNNYIKSNGRALRRSFSVPVDRPMTDRHTFNEFEGIKLAEVLKAIPLITDPFIKQINSNITHLQQINSATNKFDRDVRNLVEFAKSLTAFREICEEDQIALIKYGCTEVLPLRSILFFNFETESFHVYINDQDCVLLKLEVFKMLKRHPYTYYKSYLTKMANEWDSDPMIINLLSVVLLFNPNLPEVYHKDVIKLHQRTYMFLLQKYLQLKYGSEYESKLFKLFTVLEDVYNLGKIFRLNGAERNDMTPFLAEIFDSRNKLSIKMEI